MTAPRLIAWLPAGLLLVFTGCDGSAPVPAPPSAPATLREITLRLPDSAAVVTPLALDGATQQRGLMFVDRLPPDRGMLFVFASPRPERFWMKNCLIPLDMVFMDAQAKVVFVSDHVPICAGDPCPDYGPPPTVMVQLVLELGAGEAARHGLHPGVTLEVPDLEKLKAEAQ